MFCVTFLAILLLFFLELYIMENVTGLYAGSLQEKIEGKKIL